jgi:hypothetical protein
MHVVVSRNQIINGSIETVSKRVRAEPTHHTAQLFIRTSSLLRVLVPSKMSSGRQPVYTKLQVGGTTVPVNAIDCGFRNCDAARFSLQVVTTV